MRFKTSDEHDTRAAWLVIPLAGLLAIVVLVFYVLFNTTQVEGLSMTPTLQPAEYLLVTKDYGQPIRGDVVIIHLRDEHGAPHDIVKRIIALPGDTVEIRKDVAWVNGTQEPAYGEVISGQMGVDRPARKVPQGRIYVMGDNRVVSLDSRYIGPLPISEVQGRVEAVFAPINRIRTVH